MEEFLELVRTKINDIQSFINRLQQIIGLSNATDETIFGKINTLTEMLNQAEVPSYYTEVLRVSDNKFMCTYEPINGVCMYNEITLYHPEDGTLIWEGIEFNGREGTLVNALNAYNGWNIKVQYFYNEKLIKNI